MKIFYFIFSQLFLRFNSKGDAYKGYNARSYTTGTMAIVLLIWASLVVLILSSILKLPLLDYCRQNSYVFFAVSLVTFFILDRLFSSVYIKSDYYSRISHNYIEFYNEKKSLSLAIILLYSLLPVVLIFIIKISLVNAK